MHCNPVEKVKINKHIFLRNIQVRVLAEFYCIYMYLYAYLNKIFDQWPQLDTPWKKCALQKSTFRKFFDRLYKMLLKGVGKKKFRSSVFEFRKIDPKNLFSGILQKVYYKHD